MQLVRGETTVADAADGLVRTGRPRIGKRIGNWSQTRIRASEEALIRGFRGADDRIRNGDPHLGKVVDTNGFDAENPCGTTICDVSSLAGHNSGHRSALGGHW